MYIILGIILISGYIFWKRNNRLKNLIKIEGPKILIASFDNDSESLELVKSDLQIYSANYLDVKNISLQSIQELTNVIEEDTFDLIHLIVDVSEKGEIIDKNKSIIRLNDLISQVQHGKSKYLFFAKENEYVSYEVGTKNMEFSINLVMTLNRNGGDFGVFFKSLFDKISSGKTMPVAWNELAPQIPNANHEHVPGTLCVMGAGNVILMKNKYD